MVSILPVLVQQMCHSGFPLSFQAIPTVAGFLIGHFRSTAFQRKQAFSKMNTATGRQLHATMDM
jgi:hypothetical protein